MNNRMQTRISANGPIRLVIGVLLLALLAACASPQERRSASTDPTRPAGPTALLSDSSEPIDLGEDEVNDETTFAGNETFPGSGVFLNREAANRPAPIPEGEGEVTLNFEAQGIQEVIHAILGHMLQENYVIAPGISGEVTFSTAKPIARDQIMPVLEMLLRWNGATLIWREDRYHVLPVAQAIRGNLTPRIAGGELGRGYQVLAVPLQFIAPAAMVTILEPYAREDAVLNADGARSMLFLAGTPAELRNYMQIIETFDVDWLAGMSVGFFEISRVEVADLVLELEAMLGGEGETPISGLFRIMPFERLNSIMVITPNPHYLETIETWIRRLDRSSPEAGSRLFVYRVKNLDAEVLAGYLANVFGGEGGGSTATRRQDRGSLAPGLERAQVSSVSEFQNETSPQARQQNQTQNRTGGGGSVTLGENGEIRITAVLETNSLLIQASPSEYDSILNAIEKLDEEPLQVLIEAQVLVVELNDALRYGVSWFLSNAQPGDDNFPEFPTGEGVPPFSGSRDEDRSFFGGGLDFLSTLTRRAVDRTFVTATIRALESVSDVRTISAPSLMVRNNADAAINVGTQIPIQSSSVGVGGNNFGSTQFLNTGVILDVTPRVNPGGLVYLTISQEVSSPGLIADPDVNPNPPINNRQINTEVAIQSGQTIVLGGLIEETVNNSRSGVPFLQRIPGLGALFRSTSESINRTETLVLITPTVITNTSQLEDVSREFESKFRATEPLPGFGDEDDLVDEN